MYTHWEFSGDKLIRNMNAFLNEKLRGMTIEQARKEVTGDTLREELIYIIRHSEIGAKRVTETEYTVTLR